jgi:hypothetical protein
MVGLVTPGGAILLGRMYTPGYEVFAAADTFEAGTAGTWGGITGGTAGFTALGADIRSAKSIQYRIATPSGFGGSLMYGKNSGYLGRYNKFLGAAVTYKANGFDVGLAHNQRLRPAQDQSLTTTTVGGSYTVGDFKFFAGYHRPEEQELGPAARLHRRMGRVDRAVAGAAGRGHRRRAAQCVRHQHHPQQPGRRQQRPGRYALQDRRRPRDGIGGTPERPHRIEQRRHPDGGRLRLQPVQAHRHLHRRSPTSRTRTMASTPRARPARQAASPSRPWRRQPRDPGRHPPPLLIRGKLRQKKDACGRLFLWAGGAPLG